MWTNYHTHTTYCDGKSEMSDYLVAAKDVMSLGFSSHAPLPFPCAWCMKEEALSKYIEEINKLKSTSAAELYAGLEADFIPGIISPNQFANRLDYTIGSIHFVEKLSNGNHWEIDGSHELFLQGLDELFHGDIRSAIVRYFELTREMIETTEPCIVGHLDKIKIQNTGNKFFHESDGWYYDEILKTIDVIQATGTIVEVNTRGLYQNKSTTSYPSPWILKLLYEKNIRITLSSDAHHAKDLTNLFSDAALQLHTIGFRKLTVLREGTWQQLEFNEDGIVS